DRRAYCYLVVPDDVTEEAERRLKVLEHYTDLGSGYQVAMKDLELRGAGNLLGEDQSGFAHAVGLDTYLRLLDQTVKRMRDGGASEGFPTPEVTMEEPAYLPDAYVEDQHQKLSVYRRLSAAESEADVAALADELRDRFGPLPDEARRLVEQRRLALVGQRVGVDRILIQALRARINFRPDVVPRMSALKDALEGSQVSAEVRRIAPLSLVLKSGGESELTDVVARAVAALGAPGRAGEGQRAPSHGSPPVEKQTQGPESPVLPSSRRKEIETR
ncbi:MAG: hypothetical protein OEO23_16740, partial [Gemmatimonadota bacterium]|nr:hypothetical protein [Gemmatimonadota bacterium]